MPTTFSPPTSADHPEVFFALVGPLGVDIASVVDALEAELCAVDYRLLHVTKLSELLHALAPYQHLAARTKVLHEDERIERHMDAGDELRAKLEHGGALAALAVSEVVALRAGKPKPRTAYLFRSLKHPEEVELLRSIYDSSLVVISLYEAEDRRLRRLGQRIQRTGRDESEAARYAARLGERDQQGGDDDRYGQSVRDAFPHADFFLDAGKDVRVQLSRLIELLFGHPFRSPTQDEYAMAVAHTAARRSADLSRQVGAAIVAKDGEVLAAACNEVPKPGGGVYWSGDTPDLRDYPRGTDPNTIIGQEVLLEVLQVLKDRRWLEPDRREQDAHQLVRDANELGVFDRARITSLIEFGRVVHAEMNALAFAARRGIAVAGARLYCTTLPCHGCARHLLGAGLSEVIYIEPYPKSLAARLYPDAIQLGGAPRGDLLLFRPFTGLAPRRYYQWFAQGRRKDQHGYAIRWDPKAARPRTRSLANPHLLVEDKLCANLSAALTERGWASTPGVER